eukprot:5923581-Amphidinium_carterae.1
MDGEHHETLESCDTAMLFPIRWKQYSTSVLSSLARTPAKTLTDFAATAKTRLEKSTVGTSCGLGSRKIETTHHCDATRPTHASGVCAGTQNTAMPLMSPELCKD